MKRCAKCILPKTYPGLTLGKKDICNQCLAYKKREYLGDGELKKEISLSLASRYDRDSDYDCVVGLSGGRDSTYLAYYLVKRLGLKVLGYVADHGYLPEEAKRNIKNAADILGVKYVIEKHDLLKRNLRHTISSWVQRPALSLVEMFCTGCRLGMIGGILNFARRNETPLVVWGGTPFEYPAYRAHSGGLAAMLDYLSWVIKNPKWLTSSAYLVTQFKEYLYYFHSEKMVPGVSQVTPFVTHIRWKEKEVDATIKRELKWVRSSSIKSTWRGDCDIALLKLHVYKEILGFNDKVDNLSHLIRDGQISRGEALKRLEGESDVPEGVVARILEKKIGLDYLPFKNALQSLKRDN